MCPTCQKVAYIWNNKIGCKSCCGKQAPPLKKTSDKRQPELDEYSKLRKQYLTENPNCKYCEREATDVHHKMHIRRGSALNDVSQFIGLCREDHNRVHDNPDWAISVVFLAGREEKAEYARKLLENKFK